MKRLTEEQIQQAKRIDLLTWLRTHQPDELVQVGRTEYTTRTHDSLRISENGKWNWFSRGFGGTTALNYLIRVQGMDFVSAVRLLCEVEPVPAPPSHPSMPAPPREFHPPVKDRGTEAVTAYLKGRGIRGQVIRWCLREGVLYQTTRAGYKNCVFVGLDETGRPRAASLRGCQGRFRGDCTGSDKRYGFVIPAEDPDCTAVEVYEAPIDAMSGATLRLLTGTQNWRAVHCLALGGLNHRALEQFLAAHPQVDTLRLCLDNDPPGRRFAADTAEKFQAQGYRVADLTPGYGKDFNEALQHHLAQLQPAAR